MADSNISPGALEHFRRVAEKFESAHVQAENHARVRHERFNVFTTLLKEHDEVRLHTRFIHCLLDPKGNHDCDSLFLDLFFATLAEKPNHSEQQKPYSVPSSSTPWDVQKEASRPPHGQIDILLEQPRMFGIAIENKIYAAEQANQLEGYANYLSNTFGDKSLLVYLTLDGKESQTHKGIVPCLRISYSVHILAWLDKCIWETCRITQINQVLLQYRDVVRQLTGKTIASETMKEITNFISKHPEIIRYRKGMDDVIDNMRSQFLDRLAKEIVTVIKDKGYSVEISGNLSRHGSALQITPRTGSSLNQLPVKVWIEHVTGCLVIGIKIPNGYKTLPAEAQLLLERMNRFLNQNSAERGLRVSAPNDAWAAGWQILINQNDDAQLAAVINKDIAVTSSEICETIWSQIDLFERAASDAAQPAKVL